MPKQRYDLGAALQEVGLQFVDKNQLGQPVVEDRATGERFVYDVDADLESLGAAPKDTSIIFNTPEQPLNISPLSAGDRAKLGVGNQAGSIKFLKQKFDAVMPHEEQGLLVLNEGVWQTVDPKGLGGGDAWDMAKELGRDIADLTDVGINVAATSAGVAAGAATVAGTGGLGAAAAPFAGAAAGGAVSGAIRTSLGRYFGTYEATPEEELRDIGLESVMSLGGQVIGAGARPAIQGLVRAGNRLGRSAISNSVATVYGRLTGVGEGSMQALLSKGSQVGTAMSSAIKTAGPGSGANVAIDIAKRKAVNSADELLEAAQRQLPKKYGEIFDNVVAPGAETNSLKSNMNSVVIDGLKQLEEAGLGKIVVRQKTKLVGAPEVSGSKAELLAKLTGEETRVAVGKPTLEFVPFSQTEKIVRVKADLPVFDIDDIASKQIRSLVQKLDRFREGGTLRGKVAANRLKSLNKTLNQEVGNKFGLNTTQEFKAAVSRATKGTRESIGKEFKKAGLEKQYGQLSDLYAKFKNSVSESRKITQRQGGTEAFVNKLSTDAGRNLAAKDISGNLVELLGPRGTQMYESIVINDAASKFLKWAPKMGLVQTGAIGGGVAAGISGGISPAAIPIASQFSPRIVANQIRGIQFGAEHLKWIKNFGPDQLKLLLDSPATFNASVRATVNAIQREGEDTEALLQESGAVGENQ